MSACHARTLTLFVESFLKTIQKMLESSDPQLQIIASASFKKFSNIEEETPSYHRTYDFFIDRFAQVKNILILPVSSSNVTFFGFGMKRKLTAL